MNRGGRTTIRRGLPPVCAGLPRVLILGSFPSILSLAHREYYGNPRNRFWPIMEELFGISVTLPYEQRSSHLAQQGIALWDVAASCSRPGSADSGIRTVVANDIPGFAGQHPSLRLIALNGTMAGRLFHRFARVPEVPSLTLPSTSPANAALPFSEKVKAWARIRDEL